MQLESNLNERTNRPGTKLNVAKSCTTIMILYRALGWRDSVVQRQALCKWHWKTVAFHGVETENWPRKLNKQHSSQSIALMEDGSCRLCWPCHVHMFFYFRTTCCGVVPSYNISHTWKAAQGHILGSRTAWFSCKSPNRGKQLLSSKEAP